MTNLELDDDGTTHDEPIPAKREEKRKITKEMLTAEAGFVEGAVVQIVWKPPYDGEWNIYDDAYLNMVDDMVSIRPLTGPLAHWSLDCVPDDAEWSVVNGSGVSFLTTEEGRWLDGYDIDGAVSKRPWWCERKGK